MTLLSSKGTYGLLAMYELSKYYMFNKPVKIKEIASQTKIPQNYLEQLLNSLKKDGFVKSVRGAHGGYLLATGPSNIKILDILNSLDGELMISETKTESSVLELFFKDSKKRVENIFELTLDDFSLYEQKLSNQIFYSI